METNYYNAGVYTYEVLQEAIKTEREECALILDKLNIEEDDTALSVLEYCAEAIRARGK